VHANDLLVNEATYWETVEDVTELLPKLDVVTALALVIESVDASDGGTFVVATKQKEVFWEFRLV
jgi:hypothetical protein